MKEKARLEKEDARQKRVQQRLKETAAYEAEDDSRVGDPGDFLSKRISNRIFDEVLAACKAIDKEQGNQSDGDDGNDSGGAGNSGDNRPDGQDDNDGGGAGNGGDNRDDGDDGDDGNGGDGGYNGEGEDGGNNDHEELKDGTDTEPEGPPRLHDPTTITLSWTSSIGMNARSIRSLRWN